jgi:lipopolysaccharide/colanic/teichoic acid biosynthesis glycosyltransferase
MRLALDVGMGARMTIAERAARIRHSTSKRLLDVAFAVVGFVLSAPIWPLIALCIKLDDGGPVFYRQPRSGLRGRRFQVAKFRSMRVDADRDGARQAVAGDARVTRVGRWLRATALDELPQLWSILVGDMSVVGPRALRPGEIEVHGSGVVERLEDVDGFETRSLVRPGLTGVAQIHASRNLPRRQKFRYDRLYIRRQSFLGDVRLILCSIWISLTGTWEHRGRRR